MIKEMIVAFGASGEDWATDARVVGELVRCGECRNYGNPNVCPVFSPKHDWYCANGVRKEHYIGGDTRDHAVSDRPIVML